MADMYFIALVAPKEINEHILKWKLFMNERFGCTVALRSPAHITLVPPCWMDSILEDQLKTAIDSFSQTETSFEISLRNFSAFKPGVIYVDVIPSEPLHRLHEQLQGFLIPTGLFPIVKEDRPHHPHVTIATRDLHKKAFQEAWGIFKDQKYEASWLADGISLLKHNQKNWDVVFTSRFQNKIVID